jgi:hypothetical protein
VFNLCGLLLWAEVMVEESSNLPDTPEEREMGIEEDLEG